MLDGCISRTHQTFPLWLREAHEAVFSEFRVALGKGARIRLEAQTTWYRVSPRRKALED
jgi:hypothetical protein